jgi:Uma2 family endonuclease
MATTELMTIDDLADLSSTPGRFDLIRGELIRMSPAGARHGRIAMRIASSILTHVDDSNLGDVYAAETGFILGRDPDILLAPDVAYVRADRLPSDDEQDRFLELAPDLVVEVASPSDRLSDITDKVMEYLDAGVGLVWVVEPRRKIVNAYTPDRTSKIFTVEDELDGGDVLPRFKLPVSDIFR